jgi:hypothetical protein
MLFHHFDPETDQQCMQLKHTPSLLPNKFRAQLLAGKVMTTIVGCYDGGVFAENPITAGDNYSNLLLNLIDSVAKKRPEIFLLEVLHHHDNAPPHTVQVTVHNMHE